MRQLASIQQVLSIRPADNADALDVARIEGWDVVVRKNEFKPGDKVVFFEIDSVLPERDIFKFMEPRHYRVRTAKLRGNLSQGLIMPMSILPSCQLEALEVGDDVTEILKVVKYDSPEVMEKNGLGKTTIRGAWPSFIHHTDEPRIQSNIGVLFRNIGVKLYSTEKVNGSSTTVFWDPETGLHVCSRNVDMKETKGNKWWETVRDIEFDDLAKTLGNVAIQGELCGPGVQKNTYKLKKNTIKIYSVYDIRSHRYFSFDEWYKPLCGIGMKEYIVPILDQEFTLNHTVDELVEMTKIKSKIGEGNIEGIVFRSLDESIRDGKIGRLSFKCINPDYLLKHD